MATSETLKFTGTKRMGSARSGGKSRNILKGAKPRYPHFVLCLDNEGCEPFLWIGKVYQVIKPLPLDGPHHLRVVDEEGEDYLYGAKRFIQVEIPSVAGRKAVVQNSSRFE